LTVPPGKRQLRFFFTIAADRVGDREYEFQVLGPLASFALQGGVSISVLTLLARGTTLIEARGRALGWLWKNDPLFRVRYHY
jgi:hypothetical protein